MAENIATPSFTQSLAGFNGQQIIVLIVTVATTVALVVGLWTWGQTPDYRVLYGNLSDSDGGAIIESLQQMDIPYKFADGGGALLVPASQVHEVRLRMASQGLPRGSVAGFELMENQKFGTSQFLEQMNYQRALEGELARSVQTLAAVQSARIHLAIPKPTVFVKEQQQPGASVVLKIFPGRTLGAEQVNSIVHLISSSVPNMPAKNVTVVDQSGSLLSSAKESNAGRMDATQINYVRQIEQNYVNRIEAIITPLVGANNVRAQVTADIDFAQTEQTAEIFKPNQDPKDATLRSKQTIDTASDKGQIATGVPGALSNQPPVPATAPIVSPSVAEVAGTPSTDTNSSAHREATVNYEVDRTIRYTKLPVGSIKRLSVAVVLNNRTVTSSNGKTSTKPLSTKEKAQITDLVKDAMGFDPNRGDSLNLLNSAFNVEPEIPVEEIPIWKDAETIALAKDIAKYMIIGGIALLLLLGVIRPALKSIMAAAATQRTVNSERASESYSIKQPDTSYEGNLQAVKQMAQQEPKVMAAVVKQWVTGDE